MQIITNIDMSDATLTKWAGGSDDATVHRIESLNVAPKKWKDGKLEDIVKKSTIISSVVSLYGVSPTHYVFRLDLTSLLGFSYKGEKKMRTGVSFKLAKSCFEASFHEQVSTFLTNFNRFVEWRASQWDHLLPHTSEWSQKNQKQAPGMYFNKDTAFNGTLCSWNKIIGIEGLNTKGIDQSFLLSCIVPTIQLEKFALAYSEKAVKVNGIDVVQKVVQAFDYKGMTIESFSGGGADVTDKKGTSDLFALMSEDPGDAVNPKETEAKTKYTVINGVAYPIAK